MSDKLDLIIDSLDRLHDKHDKSEERIRSLEESRAHQNGAITAAGTIFTACAGIVSFLAAKWGNN